MLLQIGQDLPQGEFCWHDLRETRSYIVFCSRSVSGAAHLLALDRIYRLQVLDNLSARSHLLDTLRASCIGSG